MFNDCFIIFFDVSLFFAICFFVKIEWFVIMFNDFPRFVLTFHQNFQENSKNHEIIILKKFRGQAKFVEKLEI